MKKEDEKKSFRINDRIRVPKVRVISPTGEQLGILSREEALSKALEFKLDLVEIVPQAKPPVCKIIDFGKMMYEISKKEKQNRKNKGQVTKTIQFKPNIGEMDLLRKISDIQKFIDKDFRVVVQITMKGRQKTHHKLVDQQVMGRILQELKGAGLEDKIQHQSEKITAVFIKTNKVEPQPIVEQITLIPTNPVHCNCGKSAGIRADHEAECKQAYLRTQNIATTKNP